MIIKLVYEEVIIGGTETLCLRLCNFFKENNILVKLYYYEISDVMRRQFEEFNCKCVAVNNKNGLGRYAINDNYNQDDIIITFSPFIFIDCENINEKKPNRCKVFLYILHYKLLLINTKYRLLNKLVYNTFRKIVENYSTSGNFIYMDYSCIEETLKPYSLNNLRNKCKVVPIPYSIPEINEADLKQKELSRNNNFNILTVSRIEFPFKGYLLGLIQLIPTISRTIDKFELVVITSEDSVELIYNEIDKLQSEYKKYISVKTNLKYDELAAMYKKAHLYIGMGSTLVEASMYGVPSIPVMPYTYNVIADHYFLEEPLLNYCKETDNNKIIELLSSCSTMSSDNYFNICKSSYLNVKKIYSFSFFYASIMESLSNKNVDLPEFSKLICDIFMKKDSIKRILKREKNNI